MKLLSLVPILLGACLAWPLKAEPALAGPTPVSASALADQALSPSAGSGQAGMAQALTATAVVEPPMRFKFSAEEVVERLLKTQAKVAAFSCTVIREDFQELSDRSAPRRVTGTLKARPGGLARFEIKEPSAQLLISDGKTLWMVLPEAKQVFRQETRTLRTSGQFFLDLTTSIRYYARNSKPRLRASGEGFNPRNTVALELSPKDQASSGFDKVVVWVDLKNWLVLQSELTGSGLLVRARFKDIKAYTKEQLKADASLRLPDKLFHYQAPKGWEVFDSFLP